MSPPLKRLFKFTRKILAWVRPPPLLGGAKIAAVVLHTMNIEGQIHQKNPGMGQTPPPLPGNARILDALVTAIPPFLAPEISTKNA